VLTYFMTATIYNGRSAKPAGIACSLYLPLIVHTSQILTEVLFTFLLMLAVFLVISRNTLSRLMISGIVFGLALLTRPFAVFFVPFLLYWLYLNPKYKTPRAVAALLAGVFLITAPWTIRNYYQLCGFVPFANVGGLTLYNSYQVPPQGFGYNSLASVDREYFKISDETERNQYLINQTLNFIRNNPLQVIKLTALKLLHFIYPFDGYWYQVSFGSKYNIFWGIIMAFATIGILSGLRDKDLNKILLYFLLLAFLAGVIIFYGSPRFRLPLEPFLICLAAGTFVKLTQKRIYISAIIIGFNVTLFVIFHYFKFQNLFYYLKTRF
jgi:4-amino-4-deoxy-L-arabinose transferase-like glycosyltransferase